MARPGEQVSLQEANLQYLIEEAERRERSGTIPLRSIAGDRPVRRGIAHGARQSVHAGAGS